MSLLLEAQTVEPLTSMVADQSATPSLEGLNPLNLRNWDDLVLELRGACAFHSQGWAGVLRDTYRHRPCYVSGWRAGRLAALLPVMEVNSVFTGRRGVSLPFTDFCEALQREPQKTDPLFWRAVEIGRAKGWRSLEVRGLGAAPGGSEPSNSMYGHVLDLADGADAAYRRFRGSVRRAIHRAEDVGVEMEFSSSFEAVQLYYRLHCRTRQRHGVPPQPFRFFANIHQHMLAKGLGFIALARYGMEPIAAAVFFVFGRQATFKFGASDLSFQALRGNNLVMWKSILHCCEMGCDRLHFGRTSLANRGLRRFKLGFGAREECIYYSRLDMRKGKFVKLPDSSKSSVNRLFRRLPQSLARLVGAILYPHMA